MTRYRLSNEAKEDLIRIHHYRIEKFGDSTFYRLNKGEVEIMAIVGRQDLNSILQFL